MTGSSNIYQEPPMNTIEETSSTKGSLSPSPASFMESLTEHYTEAQNESRAPDL